MAETRRCSSATATTAASACARVAVFKRRRGAAGIGYDKVTAGPGDRFPFGASARATSRAMPAERTLLALRRSDGTVIPNSRAIFAWIGRQR